jgi:hypothetical protein
MFYNIGPRQKCWKNIFIVDGDKLERFFRGKPFAKSNICEEGQDPTL